jgi:acyl-CoA reductase-like NAD-dependent aldehyde dehydrogenase
MQMSKKYDLVIDGGKVSARDHFEVRNPSTGEVVGLAPQASPADLDHAVAAANKAFLKWSKLPDAERRGQQSRRTRRRIGAAPHRGARQAAQRHGLAL